MILKYNKAKRNGFTLIELLVTLSIISVLALMSFSSFSSAINAQYADTASKQLTYALEKARYYAKSNGTTTYVKFNSNSDTYIIKTPDSNGQSLTSEDRYDGLSGKMPEGTKIIDSTCSYFYYYVDGSAISSITANSPLASDCFILVGVADSYTKTVKVNSKTGKVSYE